MFLNSKNTKKILNFLKLFTSCQLLLTAAPIRVTSYSKYYCIIQTIVGQICKQTNTHLIKHTRTHAHFACPCYMLHAC